MVSDMLVRVVVVVVVVVTVHVPAVRVLLVGVEVRRHRSRVLRHVRAGTVGGQHLEHPLAQLGDGCRVIPRQGEHRPPLPSFQPVRDHARNIHTPVRRELGLVDDQEVGAPDAGAALAGDIAAAGNVKDEDLRVDEGGGEGRREVVAAGLDEHDVER